MGTDFPPIPDTVIKIAMLPTERPGLAAGVVDYVLQLDMALTLGPTDIIIGTSQAVGLGKQLCEHILGWFWAGYDQCGVVGR